MNLIKSLIINLVLLVICLVVLTCAGCSGAQFSSGGANNSTTKTNAKPAEVNKTSGQDQTLIKGTVVHISDGDTFIVEDDNGQRTTVRIHAVDAPELSQTFGKESREALRTLIANQQVEIRKQTTDRYQRVVGQVFLSGKDIGLEQIKGGFAWHFKQYAKEQTATERQAYAAAEDDARNSHLGLWSDGQPVPPQDYRRSHQNPYTKQ